MDYYEPRDDLDEPPLDQSEPSPVQKFYEGKHIFLTGGSGFMGKILMEKLLRTCNVGRISVLVRDKKGVRSQDRVASLFSDIVFDVLKLEKPGELSKVRIVTGDLSLLDLGLSQADRHSLCDVNIIFHAAATLQMDQHLKLAYLTNVHSTKLLLELAKTLPHLQAFMYVSTAYTHAYLPQVEEKLYDAVYDEDQINLLCKQLTEYELGALTPKLVGRWGNTYALTKAWAENLVSKYEGILPVGIVRPSIVVSVWKEPLEGWINNVYGAVGVVTGTALGLLRLWAADPDMVGDMIPVDIAINMTLVATVEVACRNKHLKIYNLVSSTSNPITYDILRTGSIALGEVESMDSAKAIAYRSFFLVKNKTLFNLYSIWYHAIPAFLIDLFLQMSGKPPQLLKVYIKAFNVNKSLMPYCLEKHITFRSDNIDTLWDTLDPVDQRLFYCNLRLMSWSCFWLSGLKGLRVYLLKDPMDTVPEGIRHRRRLFLRKMVFDSIVYGALSSLLYLFSKHLLIAY